MVLHICLGNNAYTTTVVLNQESKTLFSSLASPWYRSTGIDGALDMFTIVQLFVETNKDETQNRRCDNRQYGSGTVNGKSHHYLHYCQLWTSQL